MTPRPASHGESATATVLARRRAGAVEVSGTVDQRHTYTYTLLVAPHDAEPFEAEITHAFWLLELKPSVGDSGIAVRFDPADRVTRFVLAGDPRYDADALLARAAAAQRPLET
jgi:hypothetical protein